jgi:glycosyltransferase involved in cell wall biosynthesis
VRVRLPLGYIKMGIGQLRALYWRVGGLVYFQLHLWRIRRERSSHSQAGRADAPRVVASAGWYFPVYSHTFVYQELTQLIRAGFRLKFFYGAPNPGDLLADQFAPLDRARDRLVFHPVVCRRSVSYFERRYPRQFRSLLDAIQADTGLSREAVLARPHIGHAFAFARLVEAYRPQYLHSYFFYQDTVYALVASWLLDTPRGVSCYADHMLDDYDLKLVSLHLRQASVVIATSQRIRDELLALAPSIPPARVLVKVNAINADHFPLVKRASPGPGEPFVIVSVCRLEPKKGLEYMLDALHQLRSRGMGVEWVVIGGVDGNQASREYAAELRERISRLDLGHAVRLAGKQSEAGINQAFARAHLFVAPFVETDTGDKDGVPTAILEAMASGLPVVATTAGSIPEVIDDGVNGLLVPQRDAGALGDAVAALAGDEGRRAALGVAGAHTVRERFDVTVCDHVFHARVAELIASSSGAAAVMDRQVTS